MPTTSQLLRRLARRRAAQAAAAQAGVASVSDVQALDGGAHPRDPDNPPPEPTPGPENDPYERHPRPGPVPPGEGGDPQSPAGVPPVTGGAGGSANVQFYGTQFPPEFGPYLAQLARQGALDTAGQGYGIAQAVRDDLNAQVFRDYLTQLYGGDVLGMQFNLPPVDMGGLLEAIQNETNQAFTTPPPTTTPPAPAPPPGGPRGPGPREPRRPGPRREPAISGEGGYDISSAYGGQPVTAAEGERQQRYTEEKRAEFRERARRRQAGAKWGYSYGSQDLAPEEGMGRAFLAQQNLKKHFGAFADPTVEYEVRDGVLYQRPRPNQKGRIAAQAAKGLDVSKGPAWERAPDFVQQAFQNPERRAFFERNPEAGFDAWLAYKNLTQMKRSGRVTLDPATGYYTDGNEFWTAEGWKVEDGKPQNAPVPAPTGRGGGGGGGTGGARQFPVHSLSAFLQGIPGGSYQVAGNAFNPNNPASWALLAGPASQLAADLDAQKRDIRAALPRGGEAQMATANAINQMYGQLGGLRQNLMTNALGYIQGRAHPNQPLPNPMGSAASGASTLGSKYSTDKQYNLGLEQLRTQQRGQDKSFWGNVFGGLGSLLGGIFK